MMLLHQPMTDPCAGCGHAQRDHHRYPGANLNPGFSGECEVDGCPCRLYAYPKREEKAA